MVAFNAVAPFLILLGIGFAAVRLKLADRPFMDKVNAFNYKVFFPFLNSLRGSPAGQGLWLQLLMIVTSFVY